MPDGFIQLPTDSTGKKLRTFDRGTAGHDQYVRLASAGPTYYYWTGYQVGAANKIYIDIWNPAASGVVLHLSKLFIQSNLAVQTGVGFQFDFDRTSAVGTAGTALTAEKADPRDPALASVTARHAPTGGATKSGSTLFSATVDSEETRPAAGMTGFINWVPEGNEIREIVISEGTGLRIIQITASTAGTWGLLAVVTTEV